MSAGHPTTALTFSRHDDAAEGWCSICGGRADTGVRIRRVEATEDGPQNTPNFDERETSADVAERLGSFWHYRIGACCLSRAFMALETRRPQ